MKKGAYKKRIVEYMKNLGTYKEEYQIAIDTLSHICELRDANMAEWKNNGYQMVTEYTNKAGATNVTKTQYYLNNLQFNDQILKYLRELGLSPTAMKRSQVAEDEKDELQEFLSSMQ